MINQRQRKRTWILSQECGEFGKNQEPWQSAGTQNHVVGWKQQGRCDTEDVIDAKAITKPYLPCRLSTNNCSIKVKLKGSWNSNFLTLSCSKAIVPISVLPPRPASGCCCMAKVRHSLECSPDSRSPLLWGRRWSAAAGYRPASQYGTEENL